jgi:PAS domain S-box-containing protein
MNVQKTSIDGVDFSGLKILFPLLFPALEMLAARPVLAQDVVPPLQRFFALPSMLIVAVVALPLLAFLAVLFLWLRTRADRDRLRGDREQLEATLYSIGDGVVAIDQQGRITTLNPAAADMLGWSREEALGRPLTEVFRLRPGESHPDEGTIDYSFKSVLRTGKPVKILRGTILETRHRGDILIADSAAPIPGPAGSIQGVVIVFRDVTEQMAREEKLRHASRMESVGQLAAGIAHDFNNILTAIVGSAELLQLDVENQPRQLEATRQIIQAGEQASTLTNMLLDFSRKGPVLSRPLDFHQVLAEVVDLMEENSVPGISFALSPAAERSAMVGDPVQLRQAVINLCLNARDAMPGGGTVHLSTQVVHLDEIACAESPFPMEPGPFLRLAVRDTGRGIPPADLERIFDPFYTTKTEDRRTGLGLSAIHGCVLAHRGAIKVHSRESVGTSFILDLPLREAEILNTGEQPPAHPLPDNATILVIDDDDTVRRITAEMLTELGFRVITAAGGEEGLARFRENLDRIDVVLLDLVMPGLSGRETFHRIREVDPHACVVLASGFSRSDDVQELIGRGLCGFLSKPFRRTALLQAMRDAGTRRRFLRGEG